jgi:penicillin-binding protein 1A
MLADVINSGTGYRARQAGFVLPAAGKTGTTNDFVDAWFLGYTPKVVTGVWVGFDQPRTIVANGYGGELAVPIWASFMKAATRGDRPEWFQRPDDVIGANVCRVSGKLANTGCGSVLTVSSDGYPTARSQVYTEYFVKGTEPTSLCPIHTAPAYIDTYGVAATTGEGPVAASAPPGAAPPPPAVPGAVRPEAGKPQSSTDELKAAPEKKEERRRGFWSRLFGRGKDQEKKPPPKKPGG